MKGKDILVGLRKYVHTYPPLNAFKRFQAVGSLRKYWKKKMNVFSKEKLRMLRKVHHDLRGSVTHHTMQRLSKLKHEQKK